MNSQRPKLARSLANFFHHAVLLIRLGMTFIQGNVEVTLIREIIREFIHSAATHAIRHPEPTEINFDFNQGVYVGEGSLAFD